MQHIEYKLRALAGYREEIAHGRYVGRQPLQVLQRKIVTSMFQLGLEPDNRRFSPHLTLARLRDTPPAKVGRWLEHNGLFTTGPFTVDRFLLYSSVLGRKGASHTVEQEYLLGG